MENSLKRRKKQTLKSGHDKKKGGGRVNLKRKRKPSGKKIEKGQRKKQKSSAHSESNITTATERAQIIPQKINPTHSNNVNQKNETDKHNNFAHPKATSKGTYQATHVVYGIYSPTSILRGSVCEITSASTYLKNKPMLNGLFDPRMGVNDSHTLCHTCGNRDMECPGHHGHVLMVYPVFNVEYINTTLRILQSVCYGCSGLLLRCNLTKYQSIREIEDSKERLRYVSTNSKTIRRCQNIISSGSDSSVCGKHQPKWKLMKGEALILMQMESAVEQILWYGPQDVYSILEKITDENIELLGMSSEHSRPAHTMWTVLYIPPNPVRIDHSSNAGRGKCTSGSGDDLTKRLKNIIKLNNQLKTLDKDSSPCLMWNEHKKSQHSDIYANLQTAVASYQNNGSVSKSHAQYGKVKDSLRTRFQGPKGAKYGRVRNSIFGKRQNHAARSVIVPFPNARPDEVGVPQWMCTRLTFPERVTAFNIVRLSQCVDNGTLIYPGANYVVDRSGNKYSLNSKIKPHIDIGWTVLRHLVEGDDVAMNRQPSLNKNSIMGHRIKVVDGEALRLPVAVTPSYNADYDGDEMNMYVMQSEKSRSECRYLLGVGENVVRDKRCLVSFVQHSVLCVWKLTSHETTLPVSIVHASIFEFQVCGTNNPFEEATPFTEKSFLRDILSNKYCSGFDYLSIFLPANFDLICEGLEIVAGRIVSNTPITKKILNEKLLISIHAKYGADSTMRYVGGMYAVTDLVLGYLGCSISYSDTVAAPDKRLSALVHARAALKKIEDVCITVDKHMMHEVEEHLMNATDVIRDGVSMHVLQSLRSSSKVNGSVQIVESGTKGDETNLLQISAMLGQQLTVRSQRLDCDLSHFGGEKSFESRGLVLSNFSNGLKPTEYYHHLSAARTGVVDTSIKTADTGYEQRKMSKYMEDVTIHQNQIVCDSGGLIVQRRYGHDGFDSDRCYTVSVTFVKYDERTLFTRFRYVDQVKGFVSTPQNAFMWDEYSSLHEKELARLLALRHIYLDLGISETYDSPVNISMILKIASQRTIDRSTKNSLYSVHEMSKFVNSVWCELLADRNLELENNVKFTALFWENLSTQNICSSLCLDIITLKWVLLEIVSAIRLACIGAGTPAGILSAQSCASPMTQMTLSRFHKSGQSTHLVDSVSRLREICNVSLNSRSHATRITLVNSSHVSEFAAECVDKTMKYFTLSSVRVSDQDSPSDSDPEKLVMYLKLGLSRERLLTSRLFSEDVGQMLLKSFNRKFENLQENLTMHRHSHAESSDCWIILRFAMNQSDIESEKITYNSHYMYYQILAPMKLCGYAGISACLTVDIEKGGLVLQGGNMCALMTDARVVSRTVKSGHIWEVYNCLGIDACVKCIADEWMEAMDTNGVLLPLKHVMLIADTMCRRGIPTAMKYNGMLYNGGTVTKLASFEKAIESMFRGSVHGIRDPVSNYTGSVCWNGVLRAGTGCVEIVNENMSIPKVVANAKQIQTTEHNTPKSGADHTVYIVPCRIVGSITCGLFVPWSIR